MLHPPPSLKALWNWAGHKAGELDNAAMPTVSLHTAASDHALHSLRPLTMARKPAVNPNPPTQRRMPPMKMSIWRFARVMLRS